MRLVPIAVLLLLAACGGERETPQETGEREKVERPPMPELEPPPPETTEDREASGDAASALKSYYSRIEAGDYDAAWGMRSGEAGGEAQRRFADNFRAYESYQADVGVPSEPVAAGGWSYVEVPVMIRGTFRGGKPFSSAGSVTMRKAASGPEAGRGWRIYTGDR